MIRSVIGGLALVLLLASRLAIAQEPHFICDQETVPDGWVVTAVYQSQHCTGTATAIPTRLIEYSVGKTAMYACDGSPIPTGWVVSAKYFVHWCTGDSNVTALTRSIENTAGKTSIFACDGSPVPKDWVTTIFRNVDWCTGHIGNNVWTRQVESTLVRSGFYGCEDSTIPDGWIIVQRPAADYCSKGGVPRETNYYEKVAQDKVACLGSPIPTGWEVAANLTAPGCGANSAAIRLRRIGTAPPPPPPPAPPPAPPNPNRLVDIGFSPYPPHSQYGCVADKVYIDDVLIGTASRTGQFSLIGKQLPPGVHVLSAPNSGCFCKGTLCSDVGEPPASFNLSYKNGRGERIFLRFPFSSAPNRFQLD